MAWAEQRNGKWRACWRDGAGRQRYKSPFTHKAAANRYAADQERLAQRVIGDSSVTWSQWCATWETLRRVEASTLKRDRERVAHHIEPHWGNVQLRRIRAEHVQAWVNQLSAGDRSASTVRRVFHTFASSLRAATKYGVLPSSPCVGVELPPAPPGIERYLSLAEEELLLGEHMPAERDRDVVRTLLGTGMRWAELAGLHADHVNLELMTVTVAETYDEAAGQIKPYPKGRKQRVVPITPELAGMLRGRIAQASMDGCGVPHASRRRCASALLFTTGTGRPLSYREWFKTAWSPAVKRAVKVGHLERAVRIHDARHTYASRLAREGIPLAEIANLLGHTTLDMVRRYAHFQHSQHDAVRAALRGQAGNSGNRQQPATTSARMPDQSLTSHEESVRSHV